jgi:hypothetical protein
MRKLFDSPPLLWRNENLYVLPVTACIFYLLLSTARFPFEFFFDNLALFASSFGSSSVVEGDIQVRMVFVGGRREIWRQVACKVFISSSPARKSAKVLWGPFNEFMASKSLKNFAFAIIAQEGKKKGRNTSGVESGDRHYSGGEKFPLLKRHRKNQMRMKKRLIYERSYKNFKVHVEMRSEAKPAASEIKFDEFN